MMNALTDLLKRKHEKLLSVFFTAGYPLADSTGKILLSLQDNGIDFIEAGMPYSDPLADGPVIQHTNTVAIGNGMTLDMLFDQLEQIKDRLFAPVILMGYLNPVLQYGMEAFCKRARKAGLSGVILPDLPMREYVEQYRDLFQANELHFIFLITPTTSETRIYEIDQHSTAFIYAVSASATTGRQQGGKGGSGDSDNERKARIRYLERLKAMNLNHPVVVGFGIRDKATLDDAWQYASGAIIGTAYLNILGHEPEESVAIRKLLQKIKAL